MCNDPSFHHDRPLRENGRNGAKSPAARTAPPRREFADASASDLSRTGGLQRSKYRHKPPEHVLGTLQ